MPMVELELGGSNSPVPSRFAVRGCMIVVKIGKMRVENRAKKVMSDIFGFVVWGGVVNKGVMSEKVCQICQV